jgi:catalase
MNLLYPLLLPLLLWGMIGCSQQSSNLGPGEERLSPDEAEHTAAMIEAIKAISLERNPTGLVERFNQVKTLGCFDASFEILQDLGKKLEQGIFVSGARYPAQLRFANATQHDDREGDFHGLSIKLQNTPGESLWGAHGHQDFLLNSYPALFAADPGDFRDFIEATRDGQLWRYFVNPTHFYSIGIVLAGRAAIDNPFTIRYWSTTPYRHGDDTKSAVKYSVRPCSEARSAIDVKEHPDFLTDVMLAQLEQAEVCLEFMVQFQTDPKKMPIENASVTWRESDSPFIPLARIYIEQGPKTSEPTASQCESLTFNPWQTSEAHRPLGGINRTRKPIYAGIGRFREEQNQLRSSQ